MYISQDTDPEVLTPELPALTGTAPEQLGQNIESFLRQVREDLLRVFEGDWRLVDDGSDNLKVQFYNTTTSSWDDVGVTVASDGTITITGDITQTGDLDITGNLDVAGIFTQVGNVDITGDVDVTGPVTVAGATVLGGATNKVNVSAGGVVTFSGDGTMIKNISLKSSTPYTAGAGDEVILMSTGASNRVLTLPAGVQGKKYTIKKTDNGAGYVVITPDGSETIDEAATFSLETEDEVVSIIFLTDNWNIV